VRCFSISAFEKKDIQSINKEVVKIQRVFVPDMERHSKHKQLAKLYKELYLKNKNLFPLLGK